MHFLPAIGRQRCTALQLLQLKLSRTLHHSHRHLNFVDFSQLVDSLTDARLQKPALSSILNITFKKFSVSRVEGAQQLE
jgi:hypothetical protein